MTSIDSVKEFWEENPLWSGESEFEAGTLEFFEEHRMVYFEDCIAGSFDPRFLPPTRKAKENVKILDLGCGIGFWATEFALRGFIDIHAADLTKKALKLTGSRLELYGVEATLSQQNAEKTSFEDDTFDHVNCQGVIHHTPDTQTAVTEIARILKPEGTASMSVYYRNIFLRSWRFIRFVGWLLSLFGAKLRGRGRENIFRLGNVDEIVRLYDGSENPIGKSYTKRSFIEMLSSHFHVDETYLHFFPARSLPFKVPRFLHRFLDKRCGFMIYATLRNKCVE